MTRCSPFFRSFFSYLCGTYSLSRTLWGMPGITPTGQIFKQFKINDIILPNLSFNPACFSPMFQSNYAILISLCIHYDNCITNHEINKSTQTKRGKRKGGPAPKSGAVGKASATLAPEEIHYEGPPAITETIIPTVSILTVVGIIPAIASWSRQAWVRYKITTRRIRVTSGIGGKDMAEIVYNDIIELRTVKRLFGDGDMVAFLKDGAKFEMRNIPDFEETMNFILEQVDPDVKKEYLTKGDVTRPQKPE